MRTAPLPRPAPGRLTLYVGGPGYGESQVLVFPDSRCMVVDTCQSRGMHYPRALLERLDISTIDLLVITHSDLDHCEGVPDLLSAFEIGDIWRYPSGNLVEVLAAALHHRPSSRLRRLFSAMDAIDSFEVSRVQEVDIGSATWPHDSARYEVRCIAPCRGDLLAAREDLRRMVVWASSGCPGLAPELEAYLDGSRRHRPGVRGNVLSTALVIEWSGHRILLGGDVENHRKDREGGIAEATVPGAAALANRRSPTYSGARGERGGRLDNGCRGRYASASDVPRQRAAARRRSRGSRTA